VAGEFSPDDFGSRRGYLDGGWNSSTSSPRTQVLALVDGRLVTDERIEALVRSCSPASRLRRHPLWRVDTPNGHARREAGASCGTTRSGRSHSTRLGSSCARGGGAGEGFSRNLVGFVKNTSSKYGASTTARIREPLAEWHIEVNEVRACRATGVTPAAPWRNASVSPTGIAPQDTRSLPVMVAPPAW